MSFQSSQRDQSISKVDVYGFQATTLQSLHASNNTARQQKHRLLSSITVAVLMLSSALNTGCLAVFSSEDKGASSAVAPTTSFAIATPTTITDVPTPTPVPTNMPLLPTPTPTPIIPLSLPVEAGTPYPQPNEPINPENTRQIVQLACWSNKINEQSYGWFELPSNIVSFSADGQTLALSLGDNTINLWNVLNGQLLRTLEGHAGRVTAVRFAPDGRTLVSSSKDGTIKVWDVQTGEQLYTLAKYQLQINSIAFSPNGRELVIASGEYLFSFRFRGYPIRFWDTQTGRTSQVLKGDDGSARSVAFSPDGRMIASASQDGSVRIWDAQSQQALLTLRGHSQEAVAVVFSPDSRMLASGSSDETVKLWDTQNGKLLYSLEGHNNAVTSITFSADGQTLASASPDFWTTTVVVKLWNTQTGQSLRTLELRAQSNVILSPDSRTLAYASERVVKLQDIQTNQVIQSFEGHTASISSVAFSPDGQKLASASEDGDVRLWNTQTGQLIYSFQGYPNRVVSLAFSPDGQKLASATEDGNVGLWDTQTGQLLRFLEGHSSDVDDIDISTDGRTLVSISSNDRTVKLWDISTARIIRNISNRSSWGFSQGDVALSPSGQVLAFTSSNKDVELRETQSNKLIRSLEGHPESVTDIAFSPDERTLAVVSRQGIHLYNTESWAEIRLIPTSYSLASITFSPDSRILASVTQRSYNSFVVDLWDVQTGALLRSLEADDKQLTSVAFAPDGRLLATGVFADRVCIWGIPGQR
jgi:WD40 repeat protein